MKSLNVKQSFGR